MQIQGHWLQTQASFTVTLPSGRCNDKVLILSVSFKGHGRWDVGAWLEDGLVSSALGTWPGLRQHTLTRAEVQS